LAGALLVVLSGYWIAKSRVNEPHGGTRGGETLYVSGSFDPGSDLISRRACFHAR
jgi:hypothetical protein